MKTDWIIIAIVLVCSGALIFYLIRRNKKDKGEVTESFDAETKDMSEQKDDFN